MKRHTHFTDGSGSNRSRRSGGRRTLSTIRIESLEVRALLAAFSGNENSLVLSQIPDDELLSIYRTETEVQFVLGNNTADVWEGDNNSVPGVSGHGGKVLTFDTATVASDMFVGISPGQTVRFHGAVGETAFPFSVDVQQYSLDSVTEFVDGVSHFSGSGWFYSNGSIEVSSSLRSVDGSLSLHARNSVVVDGTVMSHFSMSLTANTSLVINGSVQTESGLEQTGSISLGVGYLENPTSFELNGVVSTGDAVSETGSASSGFVNAYNDNGSILGGLFGRMATGNAVHPPGASAASGFIVRILHCLSSCL